MGGQSVPSSTFQQQNLVTGAWAVPELKSRMIKLLDPSLKYLGEQQSMMLGVNKHDPAAMRQFFGLSSDAPTSDIASALKEYGTTKTPGSGSYTPTPLGSYAQTGVAPETEKLASIASKPGARTMGDLLGSLADQPGSYARGGVMSLYDDEPRGYAPGGRTTPKPKPVTPQIPKGATAEQRADAINTAMQQGYKPKGNEITFLNNYADSSGIAKANVGAVIDPKTGMATPRGRNPNESTADYNKYLSGYQQAGGSIPKNIAKQYNVASAPAGSSQMQDLAKQYGYTAADAYLGQTGFQGLGAYDPNTRTWELTNPALKQAQANLQAMQTLPSQFGQATDMFGQAASGLAGLANYSPQQVAAQQAAAQQAQASLANRGDIRDVTANKAAVDQYTAAQMKAPEGVQAMGYEAAQMQGPSSWTEEGVAQKYMSPYMQNVINVQKREKARDYAQQQNELNKQAMAAGAFGGGRQAMQRSQASRDYQQQLQDLEAIGMQKAYEQGMSQFGQESGLTQQARAANQQAINAQKQQFVQNALQAALNNYGGQLTAEQQNMIAQNAAAQFNTQALNNANLTYEQQRLAAQQMNQGVDMQTALTNAQLATGVSQSNAQLGTQASLANASNALQAGIANQQAGLQANAQGIQAYGAMGNMAQGLGSLGTAIGNYNMGVTQGFGTLGTQLQNMYANAAAQRQQNAGNVLNAPTTIANQGMNMIAGAGSGTAGTAATQGRQGQ